MSKENVEIVRRVVAAFNTPDLEGITEVASPDMVLDWSQSEGPLQGVFEGLDGVRGWVAMTRDAFESFSIEPIEFADSGDHVVMWSRVGGKGRGSGIEVNAKGTTLWEIRDGKVTRMALYQSDDEALGDAGLAE